MYAFNMLQYSSAGFKYKDVCCVLDSQLAWQSNTLVQSEIFRQLLARFGNRFGMDTQGLMILIMSWPFL